MNNKMWNFILVFLVGTLFGCSQLGSGFSGEPPLPTIVPVTPDTTTFIEEPVDNPTNTPTLMPSATPLPQHSQGDVVTSQPTTETPTSIPTNVTDEPVVNNNVDQESDNSVSEQPTSTAEVSPTPQTNPLDTFNLNLVAIALDFEKPTFLTHAGDNSNRQFIVEQAGRIQIIDNGVVNPEPFLDITGIVGSDANEQGLLSMAFHPNYSQNGLFFVNYTDKQGDTVIARYSVSTNPDVADPNSAEVLLTIGQPYANHNGGQIAFGPDGYLYVGMGDGGAANDPQNYAQDLTSLLGKILRIDVDNATPYGAPETNPFVTDADARPEIWSYGWRNPWRFSFDTQTGDMYAGDVGQNQYEEIHVEWANDAGGKNYGWRLMEGFHCFNPDECDPLSLDVVLPVTEYEHSAGCSVTGGYVYRGAQIPALSGTYLYGDYCTGTIWGLRYQSDGSWEQAEMMQTNHSISSFGQDQTGELYLIDHQGGVYKFSAN